MRSVTERLIRAGWKLEITSEATKITDESGSRIEATGRLLFSIQHPTDSAECTKLRDVDLSDGMEHLEECLQMRALELARWTE